MVQGEETDKVDGAKIAAADPNRIDRYNTSNVSLETAGGFADTNRTFPADTVRTRAHERNTIQKLKVDWIAPLHGVGSGYMPVVSVNLNSVAQWAQWNTSLLSNFSLLCFGFFIYVFFFVSSYLFSASFSARANPDTRVLSCMSRFRWCLYIHTYVYVHGGDLVKHTSTIHHSIREPLCRDKRFCVPEELTSARKYNVKYSCNSRLNGLSIERRNDRKLLKIAYRALKENS